MDLKKPEIFCCKNMELCINDELYTEYEIKYYPAVRKYFLLGQDDMGLETELEIKYCPFCGVKLPDGLIDELYSILSVDYGIKNPDYRNFDDNEKIPDKFKTSQWWRYMKL